MGFVSWGAETVIEIYLYFDTLQTSLVLKEIYEAKYEVSELSEVVEIVFLDEGEYLEYKSLAQDTWTGYGTYP